MKPKVIIIIGPMGVGKLTVAKLLAEKTGYKLSHNHLFNDLVYSLFDRGTLEANEILEELRYEMYGKAVSMKRSFIMTHAYSHNFVSLTGQTDPQYLKNLQDKMGSAGAKTYFVHLKADDEVLLERVSQESRKEFGKLTDIEIMKGYLHTKDFKSSPEMDNQIVIDTSGLDAQETTQKVMDFISM